MKVPLPMFDARRPLVISSHVHSAHVETLQQQELNHQMAKLLSAYVQELQAACCLIRTHWTGLPSSRKTATSGLVRGKLGTPTLGWLGAKGPRDSSQVPKDRVIPRMCQIYRVIPGTAPPLAPARNHAGPWAPPSFKRPPCRCLQFRRIPIFLLRRRSGGIGHLSRSRRGPLHRCLLIMASLHMLVQQSGRQ